MNWPLKSNCRRGRFEECAGLFPIDISANCLVSAKMSGGTTRSPSSIPLTQASLPLSSASSTIPWTTSRESLHDGGCSVRQGPELASHLLRWPLPNVMNSRIRQAQLGWHCARCNNALLHRFELAWKWKRYPVRLQEYVEGGSEPCSGTNQQSVAWWKTLWFRIGLVAFLLCRSGNYVLLSEYIICQPILLDQKIKNSNAGTVANISYSSIRYWVRRNEERVTYSTDPITEPSTDPMELVVKIEPAVCSARDVKL